MWTRSSAQSLGTAVACCPMTRRASSCSGFFPGPSAHTVVKGKGLCPVECKHGTGARAGAPAQSTTGLQHAPGAH